MTSRVIAHYSTRGTRGTLYRILIKFCTRVGAPDLVTHAKFGNHWFRFFGAVGEGRISHFFHWIPLTYAVVLKALLHYGECDDDVDDDDALMLCWWRGISHWCLLVILFDYTRLYRCSKVASNKTARKPTQTAWSCHHGGHHLLSSSLILRAATLKTIRLGSGSSDIRMLSVPATHNRFGDRSFTAAGPRLWNELPADLRRPNLTFPVFKQKLKTYLFGLACSWDRGALRLFCSFALYKYSLCMYVCIRSQPVQRVRN